MAEFAEIEAKDGVRMTWNVWPGSHGDAVECAIPTAVVYAPLYPSPNLAVLPYSPLRCKSCRSLLNPYCSVDFVGKIWICPFCFQRNYFPEHYQAISENNLPAELYQDYTTVEYLLTENPGSSPVYLFTVDTCVIEEELEFLKKSLIQAIALIPPNALVGLITFGTFVHVHELGSTEFPKSYVFRGSKDVSKDQLIDTLGLTSKKQRPAVIAGVFDGLSAKDIRRFLVPSTECEFTLNSVLEELERDPWLVQPGERATRCTSTALQIAANLLGVCVPGSGGRILSFLGGPCTEGSGMIVAQDLSESLRSHKDLEKNSAPHYLQAVKFYEALSKQLINQGHVLDLFACSVDQVGVAEMKVAVERTGGIIVLAESFAHTVFKDSFKRIFELGESGLGLAFNAIFEVNCSRDLKVQGVIGPCASLNKKGVCVSDNVVGQGGSTAWKMNGLSSNLTLSIFFDITPAESRGVSSVVQRLFFQFLTYYQHSDGKMHMRCTTIARQCTSGAKNVEELVSGFDQETAAAIMARLVSFKMETEADFDATNWLDKALINVSSRFGNYVKNDPSSFSLSARLAIFPQFMFNLRRSQFVQVFNNSPDETAYHRMLLNRETVVNSVVMIQPSLISYSFNSPPEPALLDVAAIMPDRILLLDSYFTIVIFHGMTIAHWRKEGYHNQPEHKVFAQLLQAPKDDADAIMKTRFPAPRLVVCDQHGSQARFLLAKLNPSTTHRSGQPVGGGDIIFTDDVSFEVFMEHLQRLAVQS